MDFKNSNTQSWIDWILEAFLMRLSLHTEQGGGVYKMIYKVEEQNHVDFTERASRRNISTGSSFEQEDAKS